MQNKLKVLIGTVGLLSLLAGSFAPAAAQTSTTTINQTATSTTYSTTYSNGSTGSQQATSTATSTTSGGTTLNTQQQIALLQTQVIVLFGRVILNLSNDASTTPALAPAITKLKQAWVGMALNHLSVIRARFGL
jgi:hypothetical protein